MASRQTCPVQETCPVQRMGSASSSRAAAPVSRCRRFSGCRQWNGWRRSTHHRRCCVGPNTGRQDRGDRLRLGLRTGVRTSANFPTRTVRLMRRSRCTSSIYCVRGTGAGLSTPLREFSAQAVLSSPQPLHDPSASWSTPGQSRQRRSLRFSAGVDPQTYGLNWSVRASPSRPARDRRNTVLPVTFFTARCQSK